MLNAGFIGFGRMGITHFSILNSHPSVKVAAVSDRSAMMMNIAGKYAGLRTYTNEQQMLDKEKLDFVVISTPADSHAELIRQSIERGLHVFCEKPFVLTLNEGREVLDLVSGRPVVNQIGYVNRFNEVFVEVKRLLETGIIGDIKTFHSEMYGPTVLKDTSATWRGKKKTGGGCMFEFASHCIDLTIYLLGKPDKVKGSVLGSIYSSRVEDIVCSTLIYDAGYSGAISVNWSEASYRKPTNIFSVIGAKGKIVADKHAYKLFLLHPPEKNNGFHQGWNTRYITDFAEPVRIYVRGNEFSRQLDYFVDCIINGRSAKVSDFDEAFKTDLVMEAISWDAQQNMELSVDQDMERLTSDSTPTQTVWQEIRAWFTNRTA